MSKIVTKVPVGKNGSVTLIDHMGNDLRVVEAARVSFGHAASKGEEQDARLIRYLMKHGHTSPFEQCELVFMIDCPLFVARQMHRHRTASINEVSRRYTSDDKLPVRVWEADGMRPQGNGPNKQGSDENALIEVNAVVAMLESVDDYKTLVSMGACREQARMVLPQGMMTQFYYKMDLHNLLGFLEKRLHPDAQLEMRLYAEAMASFVRGLYPRVWDAFIDLRLHAVKLTRDERVELRNLLEGLPQEVRDAHAELLDRI